MHKLEAKFLRSADAQSFYEAKCSTPQALAGNYLASASIKGRTVTMLTERDPFEGYYYESLFYSMLEQVGAWGSSSKGKATLRADYGEPRKAPIAY